MKLGLSNNITTISHYVSVIRFYSYCFSFLVKKQIEASYVQNGRVYTNLRVNVVNFWLSGLLLHHTKHLHLVAWHGHYSRLNVSRVPVRCSHGNGALTLLRFILFEDGNSLNRSM